MSNLVDIKLTVNGTSYEGRTEPRKLLVDFLREDLGLTGTHSGCEHGICGVCTVLVDGERINSCLALAVQYEGRSITTIEGLEANGSLHPLQKAFVENDGFQCGHCTPGQICPALGMVNEVALPEFGTFTQAFVFSPPLIWFVCTCRRQPK